MLFSSFWFDTLISGIHESGQTYLFIYLKQIVTGNENWKFYNNVEGKRVLGKQNKPSVSWQNVGINSKIL